GVGAIQTERTFCGRSHPSSDIRNVSPPTAKIGLPMHVDYAIGARTSRRITRDRVLTGAMQVQALLDGGRDDYARARALRSAQAVGNLSVVAGRRRGDS